MPYICTKKVEIPEVDSNNNPMLTTVPCEVGSQWILADEPADEEGDIRLWSVDGMWWIDISHKEIDECFYRMEV